MMVVGVALWTATNTGTASENVEETRSAAGMNDGADLDQRRRWWGMEDDELVVRWRMV